MGLEGREQVVVWLSAWTGDELERALWLIEPKEDH